MELTAVERLLLLKLTQVLEIIDPTNARLHDAEAQALELGRPSELTSLFDVIDLAPPSELARIAKPSLTLVHNAS